jgi:hypothetical protein
MSHKVLPKKEKLMDSIHNSHEPPDFSIVLGGPLFQLLVQSHLTTPTLDLLRRRIVFISLFAWLPLLLLSLVDGKAWGGTGLPFLYDIEMHVRFLVALPLLIFAELQAHQRLRLIVGQFIDRNIITEEVLPQFKAVIDSAMKLRNSVVMELILVIAVFILGNYAWGMLSGMGKISSGAGTWYSSAASTGVYHSPAAYWYSFVSRPLFQFILLRWYFRLFVWARFLWQISRLELSLIPTHPDRAAGIGFLAGSSAALSPLLLAHGAMFAGFLANPIFFTGAKLTDFKLEIIGGVVAAMMLVLGPLLVFTPHLLRAKRTGLIEYGILASRYVSEFELKWVRGGATDDEPLIGSGDIQSLADLGNSFQVIRDIQTFLFSKNTVIHLVVIILLPGLPLVLTMIPLEELITKLIGVVF